MSEIEKLLAQEYGLRKQIESLSAEKGRLYAKCEETNESKEYRDHYLIEENPTFVCANYAYILVENLNRDHMPNDGFGFEEVIHEIACDSCLKANELNSEIKALKQKRGHVRAAITRAAKKYYQEAQTNTTTTGED